MTTLLKVSYTSKKLAMFENDLTLKAHVSQLTARCYSCLRRIKSCRRALTRITVAIVVNSLIVTRLDYCNSLLAVCTKQTLDKLQPVLNYSAIWWRQSPSCDSTTPLSSALAAGKGMHLVQTLPIGVRGNLWHRVISTNCASQFQLFPTFLRSVLLLVVIWSYPEQGYNLATRHFVWLVQSPGTVSHWTFISHLHYQLSKTYSRHIFPHVPTSLTNCFQSTSSEHCTVPL